MRYQLHFIGNKLYQKDIFIAEAKQVGINRCLPFNLILHRTWGEKILLGIYTANSNYKEEQVKILNEKAIKAGKNKIYTPDEIDGRKNRTQGTAEVFGYFIVSGINIQASNDFKQALMAQLDIVQTTEVNNTIQRQCGSYIIGTSSIVKNTIEDITRKTEQLSLERKEKIKLFIAGEFRELNLTLTPINYSRTLISTDITEIPEEKLLNTNKVSFIYDYKKRTYLTKYATRGRPRKVKQ